MNATDQPAQPAKKASPWTTAQAVDRFTQKLQEIPETWVMCRDMMHAWSVLNDFHVVGREGKVVFIRRELVCMRCETVRHEDYDLSLIHI